MLVIFDMLIFIYGVYTIYSSVSMKKTRQLNSWFIGRETVTAIRDVGGYIDYIYGRTLIMGAMASLFGIIGFINDYLIPIHKIMQAAVLLFLTVCIWFYITINRAKRRFW